MHEPRGIDTKFSGSIPELYERLLVPLIFEPYAADIARRVAARSPARVLELAAGTGVATRALVRALADDAELVATDLNEPMLNHAAAVGTERPIAWRQADAMALPFPDASFDCVVCQFGAMFFPDRRAAYVEAKRVLRRGGAFIFSVWDRIEENEFADVVTRAIAPLFPDDPPRFLARTPHGYHDRELIRRDVEAAEFGGTIEIDTVAERSRAASPREPAIAYCEGTPLRNEIESRGEAALRNATDVATAALAREYGDGEVDGKIQAHVITATLTR